MARWFTGCAALMLVWASGGVALADATADAKAVGDAFAKAMAAADVPAVLALYRDDAWVIWPGQGDQGKGRTAIERVIRATLASSMKDVKFVQKSNEAMALGTDYIVNVGRWENSFTTPAGKHVVTEVRTSEVLAKTDGRWLYLVDHASVGVPPVRPAAHPRRAPRREPR